MANLFQLLTNGLGNIKNKVANLGNAQGLTPYERLFGQQAPATDGVEMNDLLKGVDTSSPYYKESMGEDAPVVNITASQNPRVGGLFNDITGGYQENRFTPISMNNFGDNKLPDGRDKGFAYRLGEGLGSIARVGESPLGRGLLTGAAIALLGGSPAQALAYGGTATALNQGNRGRDTLYRQQLANEGIDTSNVRGYINDSTYKSMLAAKQLKDNAKFREMYYDNQIKQNEIMNQFRQDQLNFQKGKEAFDQMMVGKKLSIDERKLALDYLKATQGGDGRELTSSGSENLSGTYQGINQMTDLKTAIDNLPSRITTPGIAQLSSLNPFDTDAQAFNQYVKTYKQVIGKGLEGGVLRKEDEYKYDQIIPKMGDTKAVLKKKADQLQNMLISKYNTDLGFYGKAGYNVSRFPQVNVQNNTNNKTNNTSDTVRVKSPSGKTGTIPRANLEKAKQKGYTVIE